MVRNMFMFWYDGSGAIICRRKRKLYLILETAAVITVRNPDTIYQIEGAIQNGTFRGRWHFSFDRYRDPENTRFGTLRVFNDDTLSPGGIWPLHPHSDIEVVTYCAEGEFRHADQHGLGGVLKKGHVQHTTVGSGLYHSEINDRQDVPMRFIQMWFLPSQQGLEPSMEQKAVDVSERTNRLLPLVSNNHSGSLPIRSEAEVYSCYLESGREVGFDTRVGRGIYLYLLEGGPIIANNHEISTLGAAKITWELSLHIQAKSDAELLLVDVLLV